MKLHLKRRRYKVLVSFCILVVLVISIWYVKRYQVIPDSGIYLISEIPLPSQSDNILILSPHPDDETLGAGGFIEKSIEAKSQIKVIIVSDGNKHRLKDVRHQETLNALNTLGLDDHQIVFMDLPDGKLSSYADLAVKIEKELGDFKPSIIFTPHQSDHHPDHAAVGKAAKQILQNHPEIHCQIYYYLIHYPRYPRPSGEHPSYHMLPPAALSNSSSEWLKLDLSKSEQDKKRSAIKSYKSQLTIKNPPLRSLLLDFDRQNELFSHDK